jgi:hypothetical protein
MTFPQMTPAERANVDKTRAIAREMAAGFDAGDIELVDRLTEDKLIPNLIETYGHLWHGLPNEVVAERIGRCIAAMVDILAKSDDPAARRAAAILAARAQVEDE